MATDLTKDVLAAFKVLDDLNPDSTFLSESTLSNVDSWIDTGCMALNAIISGSLHKGIPMGRITGFSGPSQSGKTLILNRIFANAQKAGMTPVIFDTEAACDTQSAENCGCDASKMKYCPVDTIEQCRNQIMAFLDSVIENNLHGKFIIGIDSLGNLISQKELNDVSNNKDAADMGTRAKALKSMLRVMTSRAAKANIPIVFTNHIYSNPTEMYPSLVKTQSGGSGPIYMASVLVQLATRQEKQDDKRENDVILPGANKVSGVTMRALTTKNRFVPPFLETEIYLNFKTGLAKYSGLLDMAIGHGVVIQSGATYSLADGIKLGYFKNWGSDTALWECKILPELEKALSQSVTFSTKEQQTQTEDEVSIDENN
jgi:RecA/RadA recombinase